jgi:hypothetical protein
MASSVQEQEVIAVMGLLIAPMHQMKITAQAA